MELEGHTLAVGEPNGQCLCFGLAFTDIRGCVPDPTSIAADVGREFHVGYHFKLRLAVCSFPKRWLTEEHHTSSELSLFGDRHTIMIRTNLQRLIPPHDQPRLIILFMFKQPHIPRSTLLPLPTITIEFEQFGAHLESLLFEFLVGFGLDFFGQVDYGLEVDFW